MPRSPLGETLRKARLEKNITFEDAERVTRIPRKYLEALELENFGILPAPVYARGFLRSYASYLGLEPKDLLPFFPVGHVEEPVLESLPEVTEPRTWNPSSLIAIGVVGALIVLVVVLYSLGSDSNPDFRSEGFAGTQDNGVLTGDGPGAGGQGQVSGPAIALPDLAGQTLEEAVTIVEETGATYLIVGTTEGDIPAGVVVAHDPGPGDTVGPGDLVTITVSQ
ncbi:MAG: helix-turn-helix domain-containing protein [Chloroflexi bacterium]|nr:helix-turn-helix domain-containing protein [Chloroflexota bacterium]